MKEDWMYQTKRICGRRDRERERGREKTRNRISTHAIALSLSLSDFINNIIMFSGWHATNKFELEEKLVPAI